MPSSVMVHHYRVAIHQLKSRPEPEPMPLLPQQQHHHKDCTTNMMDPHRSTLPHILFTQYLNRRPSTPAALLRLFLLFSLISCTLVFAPRLLSHAANEEEDLLLQPAAAASPPCSSLSNNTLCCDRTARRSDVCFMRGDVRTHSASSSLLLHLPPNSTATVTEERIRPYTRKWEAGTMSTIDELRLRAAPGGAAASASACDVYHDVPAVVFSTGGYTGNVYHEFNDGIIPLYITSQRFNRRVVFVILEYHDWWVSKYADVLSQLSDFPPVDFAGDKRTHCFPEAIVGLRIHDELAIDSTSNNKSIFDFRGLLHAAYAPRAEEFNKNKSDSTKPKLVMVSRTGSRAIENERAVARVAEEVGFNVEVLRPRRTTELAEIYAALDGADAMVGVHGAAMTHLLFMRPTAVFIQVVPLGTEWAAEAYYGEPAKKLGLKYVAYKVRPRESSLYREYKRDDPVLRDPESVNGKGWETTKRVYLDGQKVRLDLGRFRKRLVRAHQYLVERRGKKMVNLGGE